MISPKSLLVLCLVGCTMLVVIQLVAADKARDDAFNEKCPPESRWKAKYAFEKCYDSKKCVSNYCHWNYLKDDDLIKKVAQDEGVGIEVYNEAAIKKLIAPLTTICKKPIDYKEPDRGSWVPPPCVKFSPEESFC